MGLHVGIDMVGWVSNGVYSVTYGNAEIQNRCNLFAFYGMIEDAVAGIANIVSIALDHYRRRRVD